MIRLIILIVAAVLIASCASHQAGSSPGYYHSRHWGPDSLESENFERNRIPSQEKP